MILSKAYKEIFKTENLTKNLKQLNSDFKKSVYVNDILNFLIKEKKKPICTPFLK